MYTGCYADVYIVCYEYEIKGTGKSCTRNQFTTYAFRDKQVLILFSIK